MKLSTGPALLAFAMSLVVVIPAAVGQVTHTGDLFNFFPNLGACGHTNTSSQFVATVSNTTFNTFSGATANPNKNPICGRKLLIKTGVKSVTAYIVDYYTTSLKSANNVGVSPVAFQTFAPLDDGVVANVTWSIV